MSTIEMRMPSRIHALRAPHARGNSLHGGIYGIGQIVLGTVTPFFRGPVAILQIPDA